MAKLIPPKLGDDAPSSERKVFEALAQLPDTYTVIHGVNWLNLSPNAKQRVGETDLVILHPKHGVLVVEVKGGGIFVEDGQWFSQDRYGEQHQLSRSPAEQARGNLYLLKEKLENQKILKPHHFEQGLLGYAVWFPDVDKRDALLPPDLESELVLDSASLFKPLAAIEQAYGKWHKHPTAQLEKAQITNIRQLLTPNVVMVQSLDLLLRSQEQELVDLTDEQKYGFKKICGNRRLLISGGAGTGKTVLACEDARRLGDMGKQTLLLCFNRLLSEHLKRTLADHCNVAVNSYHSFVESLCLEAGIDFEPPEDANEKRQFFQEQTPLLLLEAAEMLGRKYDALIVDEGQDFLPDWWESLDTVLADHAVFHCFHDANQTLFQPDWKPPFDEPTFGPLMINCRNTAPIGKFAIQLGGIDQKETYRAADGVEPQIIRYENGPDHRQKLATLLEQWIEQEHLLPNRIVILSPFKRAKSVACSEKIGKWRIYDLDKDGAVPVGITFSTIHAFKGLEADAIILADLDGSKWAMNSQLLYVAASRARHLLAMFAKPGVKFNA